MPYQVVKRGEMWEVMNKESGKTHGKHASREKAMAQMRLLYGVERGNMKPMKEGEHMMKGMPPKKMMNKDMMKE